MKTSLRALYEILLRTYNTVYSMNKGTIKQFFGPEKIRIAVFALFFIASSVSQEVWNLITTPEVCITPILAHHGFPLSFFNTVACWGTVNVPGLPIGFFPLNLVIDLIFWYLLSCLAVSIYEKIKKERSDGS